jgi:DNA-binding transcriptional regulator YhcF (GntR family)
MKFVVALFLMTSMNVMAQVAPQDVEKMLQQMVRENVISAEEAEKAKIRMKTMNSKHWADINQKAAKVAARMPASTPSENLIEEVHGIDLDGAQFKTIQSEIKKIMPQFRD